MYAQAEATRTMAAAQMRKAELLEEQNKLLLMTMPDDRITTHEAREYLRLRRQDELKKLRRKLAEEEDRERMATGLEFDAAGGSSASKRRRQGSGLGDFAEGEGSQRRNADVAESEEAQGLPTAAVGEGYGDGGQRGSTSLPEDEDCEDGFEGSQTQGGSLGGAGHRGLQAEHWSAAGENSTEQGHCDNSEPAGMWTQTGLGDRSVRGGIRNLLACTAAGLTWIVWIHVSPQKATQWMADSNREGVSIGVERIVVGINAFAQTVMSM
jgi:hypothetical protein